MDADCTTILCFDVTKASGYYSQLAGVLSGFAFAAIVLLIQSQLSSPQGRFKGDNPDLQNVLISFITAFLGLIVATFLFAVIAGEEAKIRAMTSGFLSGVVLSIAVLKLFYGIIWLFRAWGMQGVAAISKDIVASLIPLIVYTYIGVTALDVLAIANGKSRVGTWIFWLITSFGLFLIAIVIVSMVRQQLPERWSIALSSDTAVRTITWVSLITLLVAALGVGIISECAPSFAFSESAVAAVIFVLFLALVAYVLLIRSI